jgi:hypothetical protein
MTMKLQFMNIDFLEKLTEIISVILTTPDNLRFRLVAMVLGIWLACSAFKIYWLNAKKP